MPEPSASAPNSYWDRLVAAAKQKAAEFKQEIKDDSQYVSTPGELGKTVVAGAQAVGRGLKQLPEVMGYGVKAAYVPGGSLAGKQPDPTFSDGTPAFTNAVGLSPKAQEVNKAIEALRSKIPQGGTDGNWVDRTAINASKSGPGKYVQEKLLNPIFDRARASIPNDMELPDDSPIAEANEVTGYAPSPASSASDKELVDQAVADKAAHDLRMAARRAKPNYMVIVHKSPYSE